MRHTLAQAKVQHDELQLTQQRQLAGIDILGCLPPQLDRPAGPPVLLLAIREEASRQLQRDAKV